MSDEIPSIIESEETQKERELMAAMKIATYAINSRSPNLDPSIGYPVLFISLSIIIAVSILSIVHHSTVGMLGLIGIIGGLRIAFLFSERKKEYEAVLKIIESGDTRTTNLLVCIIRVGGVKLKDAARHALVRILSETHYDIATAISSKNKKWLTGHLKLDRAREQPEFALAILHTFEFIGGQEQRKAVAGLAEFKALSDIEWKLCEAAQQCLAKIEARTAKVAEKQTLLRASSAVSDSADALLRPASAAGQTHDAELLRPVEEEKAE